MGQDGSVELYMARISTVIVKLQHPQEFGLPTGIPARGHKPMTMPLHIYWPNGSIELEMVRIGPAVVELQRP